MNSAAQPSILVDDSDAYYYPLLAYARVGEALMARLLPTSGPKTYQIDPDPVLANSGSSATLSLALSYSALDSARVPPATR